MMYTAVNEQKRNGVLDLALLMNIMYVQSFMTIYSDVTREHRQRCVDIGFSATPIIPMESQLVFQLMVSAAPTYPFFQRSNNLFTCDSGTP